MITFMRIAAVLVLSLMMNTATAKSAVWKVSKAAEHLYLAGSVHVMRESDYPLPPSFNVAWADADVAVFETDMSAMLDPQFQQQMMAAFANPKGVTAESLLQPAVWKQLQAKAAELRLPIEQMQGFHPSMIAITLSLLEMQRLGISPAHGIDTFYSKRAGSEGKPVGALESPSEQISYLTSLKHVDADKLVTVTLKDVERLGPLMAELIGYWRQGDMPKLFLHSSESMLEFPAVYSALVTQRNERWVERLKALISDSPVEFVMVGSLHLAGPDSVLKLLEQQGYTITQLP